MITKIKTDYIGLETPLEICGICKSLNTIPCDHKIRSFRTPDRIDDLIRAVNEIIDFLNTNEASS